jgi:hypothetical protein
MGKHTAGVDVLKRLEVEEGAEVAGMLTKSGLSGVKRSNRYVQRNS